MHSESDEEILQGTKHRIMFQNPQNVNVTTSSVIEPQILSAFAARYSQCEEPIAISPFRDVYRDHAGTGSPLRGTRVLNDIQ